MNILRIVTVNIRHNVDFADQRLPLLADEIVRLKPHIIGLQEVMVSTKQLKELVKLVNAKLMALGIKDLKYTMTEHLKSGTDKLYGEGIGIMSSLPMDEIAIKDLGHGRIIQRVRVKLGDSETSPAINFFNVHMHHQGSDVRAEQAKMVMEFVSQYGDSLPSILVGDLNSTSDEESIATISAAMTDAYVLVKPVDVLESFTFPTPLPQQNGTARPNPVKRIDYIFSRSPERGVLLKPYDAEVCFKNHDDNGIYPSDHFGVTVDFEVSGGGFDKLLGVPPLDNPAQEGDNGAGENN